MPTQRNSRLKGRGGYRQPSMRINRFTSGLPKVVVLHQQTVIREALTLQLRQQVDVVAQTRSGKAAIALSELFVPDVVVVSETVIDGAADFYIPALLQTGARVLMVTAVSRDVNRLLEWAALGVSGLVDADQGLSALGDAVTVLAEGGAIMPSNVVAAIAAEWRRLKRKGSDESRVNDLTVRELEVLGAMSDGMSTKAVAHHLGIAVKTVENHKTRIFEKLDVRTQSQAVAVALGSSIASAMTTGAPAKG